MAKRLILVSIILAVLFLGGFYYLSKPSIKNIQSYFKKNIPEQSTQDYDWKIPELLKGYNWVQSNATDTEMQDSRMFFDNRNAVATGKIPFVNVDGDIVTKGKIFQVSVTDKDVLYNDAISLFTKFDPNLEKNGWSQSTQFGDYYIMGMAASGVSGGSVGIVKRNGFLIRTVVYTDNKQWTSWEGPGSEAKCPCSIKLTFFVGDPVDLRSYIHN